MDLLKKISKRYQGVLPFLTPLKSGEHKFKNKVQLSLIKMIKKCQRQQPYFTVDNKIVWWEKLLDSQQSVPNNYLDDNETLNSEFNTTYRNNGEPITLKIQLKNICNYDKITLHHKTSQSLS